MSWTMRHRRRTAINGGPQLDFYRDRYTWWYDPSSVVSEQSSDSPFLLTYLSLQDTWDVDRSVHPRNKNSKDDGGPFRSKRMEIRFDRPECKATAKYSGSPYNTEQYITGLGSLISNQTNAFLLMDAATINQKYSDLTFPSLDLNTYGAKALNRLDPTRDRDLPDVAQLLAELYREGLPKLPFLLLSRLKNLKALKGAGSEYLNAVFGWRPLLSDIAKMLKTYLQLEQKLSQLRKDNGQSVRRSGTLFYNRSVSGRSSLTAADIYIYPGYGFQNIGSDPLPYGPNEYWTETEERVWFAGKGSYILPIDLMPGPSRSDIEDYLRLLLAVPSPATVYELLPWSWLLDWFANLGDIVQQAFGSGVGEYTMDYCYLMRKRVVREYYVANSINRRGLYTPQGNKYALQQRGASCVVTSTTKERVAATPFGFGLTLGSLSASQVAILTALGLSRQNFI